MLQRHSVTWIVCVVLWCVASAAAVTPASAPQNSKQVKKPALSLRASPQMGFAPARIVLTADINGGPDDYEDFYCATVEWDWGDGTMSEASSDCEPYEAGKSEIRRHYVTEHVFRTAGAFRVQIRLKQKGKVVGAALAMVRVNPGFAGDVH
jgi:hypothetical protein